MGITKELKGKEKINYIIGHWNDVNPDNIKKHCTKEEFQYYLEKTGK